MLLFPSLDQVYECRFPTIIKCSNFPPWFWTRNLNEANGVLDCQYVWRRESAIATWHRRYNGHLLLLVEAKGWCLHL